MRSDLREAERFEALPIERRGALLEIVFVADGLVFLREGFQERDAAAQLGERRESAIEFAHRQVMQHVAADQQVGGRAGTQAFEVGEARQVQAAATANATLRASRAAPPIPPLRYQRSK